MDLKNSFFSLLDEIKKSVEEKNISEELHTSFVVFVYKLYMALLKYVITTIYNVNYFVQTYLPLPKINSI
jgi:hypothetical protein